MATSRSCSEYLTTRPMSVRRPEAGEMGCAKAVEKEEMRKRIVKVRKKYLNMVVLAVVVDMRFFWCVEIRRKGERKRVDNDGTRQEF